MGCEMFTKWRNVGNIGVNVGNNNPCIESNSKYMKDCLSRKQQ
jgi:hypothetical protein